MAGTAGGTGAGAGDVPRPGTQRRQNSDGEHARRDEWSPGALAQVTVLFVLGITAAVYAVVELADMTSMLEQKMLEAGGEDGWLRSAGATRLPISAGPGKPGRWWSNPSPAPAASSSSGVFPSSAPSSPSAFSPSPSPDGSTSTFDVVQFNIDHGGVDGGSRDSRRQRILAWLQERGADVVGLCEANSWGASLHEFASEAGYDHSAFFATHHGYPLALLSRSPIKVVGRYDAHFERGVLHAVVNGVHFFVAHLNAHSAAARVAEGDALRRLVVNASRESPSAEIVVMGDLNTLSPLDTAEHANMTVEGKPLSEALATLPCYSQMRRKFMSGVPLRLDYRAMAALLQAGLVDPAADEAKPTEPTAIPCDQAGACACPHLRLDYMLVSRALAAPPRQLHIQVLEGPATDTLSDHYPLAATWRVAPSTNAASGTNEPL